MAANININNRFQLNDIILQNNIQLPAEQKVIKIDQEISVRETYKSSLESSREAWKDYAKLTQDSKALSQKLLNILRDQISNGEKIITNNLEQIDLWKTVIKLKGLDDEKSNAKIINNSENPNKKVISLNKEQVILQKKVEISEKNVIEAGKKIAAIEKYTQKLEVQSTIKKDVVVSTYKPTSTQLSTLVCDNYALNKSDSGAVDIKPKYSLPVIYQSQKNIYESVLNSLLLKLIV
jgi:hypothetical protein